MQRSRLLAVVLGGSPLIALLMCPIATAQQIVPPAPRTITVPPTTAPQPAPGQVVEPSPAVAPDTPEEQARQDRQLAESMRGETELDPTSVRVALPSGWVRVAVDLDGDGTFDAIETIHVDDLSQARMISANRQRMLASGGLEGGSMGQADEPFGPAGQADQDRGPGEIELSGTVREIREFMISGSSNPHRIARLETEDGTAKVDFGPADERHAMNIEEGDELTVVGHRGMINERPVLMARSISRGDDSMDVESPDDGMIKRVRGEVIGTRTVIFRGHDEDHLITEIELRSGNRAEVILGPKSKLEGLELNEGDMIALLVRPALLNGQPAMAAEQIRFGDQAIAVSDPVDEPVRTETDPLETDDDAEKGNDAPGFDAPRLSDDPASNGDDDS